MLHQSENVAFKESGDMMIEVQYLHNLSRSEVAFTKALFELMEKKNYTSITIRELAITADYDRKTFYRHFNSKEDILKLYCSNILKEMATMEKNLGALTFYTAFISYFQFWQRHKDFLYLLEKHNLLYFLENNHAELIYEYVGREVQPEIPISITEAQAFSKYSVLFTFGGLWSVLIHWIENKCQETPEELTEYLLEFFKQSINLLR